MSKSYAQFKALVLGRGYDIDYNWGWQCWDGYAEYCIYQGVPYASCTVTHYVQDIWTQRTTNGMLNYFTETRTLQPGDVVVFRPCSVTPTSHIAIFDSDAGGGYGNFLGQNQGSSITHPSGGSAFNIIKLPYWATYDTAFRPKTWSGTYTNTSTIGYSEKQLINENGTVTLTQAVNKRRDRPDGMVVETLPAGKKLTYTQKWVGSGHRYISWVEHQQDGCMYRYFVAISGSEKHGVDMWAKFDTPKPATTAEHGWAKFKVDGVAIRKGSPTGEKVGQVSSGQVVEYTAKAVTSDHRYIVYTKSGVDFYVACSPTAKRSAEWADFYATDPRIETEKDKKTESKDTVKNTVNTDNVKHWGVDISQHNGSNFDVTPYEFVLIRSNYGTTTDPLLETYVNACKKAGIPYGFYCYSYALSVDDAHAEAAYTLSLANKYKPTLGIWYDMEDADNYKTKRGVWTKDATLSFCQTFCKDVKSKGWYTGIYSSSWFFQNWYNTGLEDYDKWVAQWDENDGKYHSDTSNMGTIHQYSSVSTDGKALDLDAMYADFDKYKNKKDEKKDNIIKKEDEKPCGASEQDKKDDTNNAYASNKDKEKIQKKMIKQIIKILKKMLKL